MSPLPAPLEPDPRGTVPGAAGGLLDPVPFDWSHAPATTSGTAWEVLSGALWLTYGLPGNATGATLSLASPRTVYLDPASPPFVVFPGNAAIFRATVEGTRALRRAA